MACGLSSTPPVDGRTDGPIPRSTIGTRMDRHAATRRLTHLGATGALAARCRATALAEPGAGRPPRCDLTLRGAVGPGSSRGTGPQNDRLLFVSSAWTIAICMFVLSILAVTRYWVPERWRGRERRYAALTATAGAVFAAAAALGWSGWLLTSMGAGTLVLSVLAVTRIWTPPRLRGFELPFAVLAVGFAVVLIPGGVYLQTDDEMRGAVPTLLLTGLAVIVAGWVFVVRRERRLRRVDGTGPLR
jgi:hypothetical protein